MTFQDFKTQLGVSTITFEKGKGRMYAKVLAKAGDKLQKIDLFCSSDCDLKKPLFVNEGAHGAFWVGNNTNSTVVATL